MSHILLNDVVNVKVSIVNRDHCKASIYVEKTDGTPLWSLRDFYLNVVEQYDSENLFRGTLDVNQIEARYRRVRIFNDTDLNGDDHLGITIEVYSW